VTDQTTLRLGTRASALATTQSGMIADRLKAEWGVQVELVPISTEGDRNREPLAQMGGTGVFVAALREALLRGEIDLAVHSLKDIPTQAHDGLVVAAIPPRVDPRDVLVARDGLTLAELPAGAKVGTGSPRRRAQLNALGLGLDIQELRGNVDTRIGKVASGALDGVLLARAGLLRLGRADEATEIIDPLQMLPAPGQGALACECRADDDATIRLLERIDDSDTRAAVTAERSLLATLEAGCSAPVGALADIVEGDQGPELWLRAVVGDASGSPTIRMSATGDPTDAAAVGQRLAVEMLAEGAAALMGDSAS
jgi:hydroxymethylbilane synthase